MTCPQAKTVASVFGESANPTVEILANELILIIETVEADIAANGNPAFPICFKISWHLLGYCHKGGFLQHIFTSLMVACNEHIKN